MIQELLVVDCLYMIFLFSSFSSRICCTLISLQTTLHKSFLQIWSHLLKKSLMKNFIFCAVRTFIIHVVRGFNETDLYWISIMDRSSHQRCSIKAVFLKIWQNSQEIPCARVSFLTKLYSWTWNFIKEETLAQVFYCDFCEIFKNRFFIEHLRQLLLNRMISMMNHSSFVISFSL